jgi:large subunit ribosomal protein L4
VLEDFDFDQPKTKELNNLLENLKITDKKSLLVLSDTNKNIYLSSRNLQKAKVVTVSELATYKIMNSTIVLFAESSLAKVEQMFGIQE